MTKKARLQTKPATPKPTISLSQPSILQRTCACGGVPGLTGECEACSSKRLSSSPGATNPSTLADRSSNDHTTAQSPQSPLIGYSFGKLAIAPKERLGIQAKLAIGQPGDRYEQEADRIATQVTQSPATQSPVTTPSPTRIARQPASSATLGTAKTTAPVASLKPQTELLQPLTNEVTLFQNAKVILRWIKARLAAAKKAASGATPAVPSAFTLNDLFTDAKLIKQLKPQPKSSTDLQPAIDLLLKSGVLSVPSTPSTGVATSTSFAIEVDPKTGDPDPTRLDEAEKQITTFTRAFEQRIKRPSPLNPIVATEVLPKNMAAGSAAERKPETDAETTLTKLEAEKATVEASSEDADAKQKKLAAIEEKIQSARKKLRTASGYHTFAKDVVNFLKRLYSRNTTWTAGTYPGHSWGEFSVDIFLKANLVDVQMPTHAEYSGQYWKRDVVRQFFDDLNTTAEEEDPDTGKFAWRGIYNDVPLAEEINKKYGSGRVIQVENHGPAPDHKLHIHLDLRPITLKWDAVRGYKVENGRVVILP